MSEASVTGEKTDTAPAYAIKVRSYEVFNSTVTGQAVHNEIIFEADGKTLFSLNGNPWKRETGMPNFPGHGDNNTLRVHSQSRGTIADNDTAGKFPVVGEQNLYTGNDPAKFLELAGRAAEASAFINAQNMDYIMVDPIRTAQNSNSVAHTLTKAMGLEYPPETENLWAPGDGRTLLPDKFRSVFDNLKDQPDWPGKPANQPYLDAITRGMEGLDATKVSAQILKEPTYPSAINRNNEAEPLQTGPVYFNPSNTKAPDSFLQKPSAPAPRAPAEALAPS